MNEVIVYYFIGETCTSLIFFPYCYYMALALADAI
jgi:hypothetical protein